MRVLVTGGAGFIGSHICGRLIKDGHEVLCVDDFSSGKYENIAHLLNKDKCKGDNITLYPHNILELTYDFFKYKEINAILHLAATGSVPKSMKQPEKYHVNNVDVFFYLLEAARHAGIKRFVYASSSSVYGNDTSLPKREYRTGNALSPYAMTKQTNELYARTFAQIYGLECVGLRYFNVFGPNQNPDGDYAAVIPKFIKTIKNGEKAKINGDGSFTRDFTYVDNVVEANMLALFGDLDPECWGMNFNIAAGEQTSILKLHNIIERYINFDGPDFATPEFGDVREGDISHSYADVSLAKEYLGYKPLVSLEEGLNLMLKEEMPKPPPGRLIREGRKPERY